MKITIVDENNIIVFLNKFIFKDLDFENKEETEKRFKQLFLKLKNIYGLDINGYYNINIYKDNYYGMILEIEHEEIEYLSYSFNSIDMRINVINNQQFLYEINDILDLKKEMLNKIKIYRYKNKYYLFLLEELGNIDMGNILENCNIIYGNIASDIINLGYKINLD